MRESGRWRGRECVGDGDSGRRIERERSCADGRPMAMRLPLAHEWDRWLPWRGREGEVGGGASRRSPGGGGGGPGPRLRARPCVGGGGGRAAREVLQWAPALGAPGAAAGAGAGCGCGAGTRAKATVGGGRAGRGQREGGAMGVRGRRTRRGERRWAHGRECGRAVARSAGSLEEEEEAVSGMAWTRR